MRRTTLKISEDLDSRLRHEAERRGVTIAEITREALEAPHGGPGRRLGAAAAGRSGRDDISERIEQILAAQAREPSQRWSSTRARCTPTSTPTTGTTRRAWSS